MSRRSRAREVALQSLYQADLNPGIDPRDRARFHKGRLRSAELVVFADGLVDGVVRHREALVAAMREKRQCSARASMAATDRTVLLIAAFELLHTDTPGPVVVDEAIELSRRYGSEASPRFVAGILGRLLADRAALGQPAQG